MSSLTRSAVLFTAFLASVALAPASTFLINTASTTAQTLGTSSGQTGDITATGSLTVSGATVAVTISGNNETLTNLGTLSQTGTGRAIRDNTGVTGLIINNGSTTNSTALMQTADADVIQMNKTPASVTLNNYGTMTSLNASAGGSQAVDFTAILSGSNAINNFSTGIMQASEADAVRPGVNGVVNNDGLIKSTTSTGSSSDGVDMQTNSGLVLTNASNAGSGTGTGLIEGARHGVTGGALNNTTAFTASITNNPGGTIKGDNGAGLNFDGFNALQTLTVVNHGTITGNGITGDGDGIDSDGLITLTNTGLIRSINAFSATPGVPAQSEGISVGGGTITNSGTIEGLVASGNTNAVGRGISLLGNDITAGPLAGTREAIYGDATVTNQSGGLIRGDSDSGIAADGPASGFTVTINNNAGATIRGGGTTNAAIRTGFDNDIINNAGTIDGSSGGKAIEMGAGNNTLNITGGTAVVQGDISGGIGGTNLMTIDPGAGNSFSYSNTISNFNDVQIKSGTVTLDSPGMITSSVSVKAGAAFVDAGTLGGTSTAVTVENGGKFYVTGLGITGNAAFSGTDQTLALQNGANLYFDLDGTTRGTSYDAITGLTTLNLPSSGEAAHFNLNYLGSWTPQVGDTFDLIDFTSLSGSPSLFDFTPAPLGYVWDTSTFATTGTISLSAAPEPGRAVLLLAGLAGTTLRRRRSQKSSCPLAQRV